MKSALTTFLMSIARYKYREYARSVVIVDSADIVPITDEIRDEYSSNNSNTEDEARQRIVAHCISILPNGCKTMLTKFYYEKKSLDTVLAECPTYSNKNALKTGKYKCIEKLKKLIVQELKVNNITPY